MREEKSEEPIRLEPAAAEAFAVNPNEVLLEGTIELRPCHGCRRRLYIRTEHLGRMIRCPACACALRALAAAGPFAGADFDGGGAARSEPPIALVPAGPAPAAPVVAPVVPFRRADPIDERSPMVDTVAQLQWVGGAFLIVVAIHQLATFWRREHAPEGEELLVCALAAGRTLVAGLLFASSSGVLRRTAGGWILAMGLSAIILAGTTLLLMDRADGGNRARFDFGILLELPTFLIAVVTFVVLLVPRYRAEFRLWNDQSGTM